MEQNPLNKTATAQESMAPSKYKVRQTMILSICKMVVLVALGFTVAILYLSTGMDNRNFNLNIEQQNVAPLRLSTQEFNSNAVHDSSKLQSATEEFSNARLLSSHSTVSSDPSLPKLLAEQYNYESTMRSCLGKMCFDQAIENSELVRVGLLGPPQSGVHVILDKLIAAGVKNNSKLELTPDTHVPPYGYGKNHGWSRIIRIVRCLIPHAYSLVADKYQPNNKQFKELFDRQIKQLMRWHCRLNHVAAHTSMLTIFTEDLVSRPSFELEKILSFIGFKLSRAEVAAIAESASQRAALLNVLTQTASADAGLSDPQSLLRIPADLYDTATSSIQTEMQASKELTKWPCQMFRPLHKGESAPWKLPLSSPNLAANCTGKFVKCSVKFDQLGG